MGLTRILAAAARGLGPEIDRYREKKERDEYIQQNQAQQMDERNFASAFSKHLLSDDVDGAVQLFDQFKGKVSPQTAQSARNELMRAKQEQKKAQAQRENISTQAQSMAQGATPQEGAFLADAGRAGSGLSALMGVRNNVQGRQAQAQQDATKGKVDIIKALAGALPEAQQGGFVGANLPDGYKMPDSGEKPNEEPVWKNKDFMKRRAEMVTALADAKFTPEQALAEMKAVVGGELPKDVETNLMKDFGEYALRVKLGEESNKKLALASGIQINANKIIKAIEKPEVIEAIGKVQGVFTNAKRWLTGEADAPPEVIDFLFKIGMAVDDISRMKSGAALTQDEIALFQDLLGSELRDPKSIQTRMVSLIENMQDQKEAIYTSALTQKYGGTPPPEVLARIPKITPQIDGGSESSTGGPLADGGDSEPKFNPQTGRYE